MPEHPLTQARSELPVDTGNVPIRYRPRFTTTEALILNTLVNAAPDPVSMEAIQRLLQRYSRHGMGIMESSVKQAMVQLRAKLGEKAYQPRQIVSVTKRYKKPGASHEWDHIVGYRWVDPYAGDQG
jgi:DNA-binding response OmpR family regulator